MTLNYRQDLVEKLKVAFKGSNTPWQAAFAIGEKETKLWPQIDPYSWFYIERLPAAKITGLTVKDIEKLVRPTLDKVILHRFEEKNWEWAHKQEAPGLWLSRKFLLSCSFGPFQKSMRQYVKNYTKEQWVKLILEFKDSQPLQIKQVLIDCKYCIYKAEGDWELAFSLYNSGKLEKSLYGKETLIMYKKWLNSGI